MSHCPVLHRFAAVTLSCLTAGAGAAFASASSDPSSLCDKFGAHEVVFLGTAGAPVEREVLLAPDLKPEVLPLLPVVVERSFREFEFSGLLPGEYLLGVNLEGRMYRSDVRTYYPGTPDGALAVPIAIAAGATRDGLDFRLPPEVASGEIVVHIDARGAAGEVGLCVSGASNAGSGSGLYPQFARSAPVPVRVLEGRQYRFVAHVERPTGHSESREVAVTGTAGRQELTLVASRAAMPHTPNDVCGAIVPRGTVAQL